MILVDHVGDALLASGPVARRPPFSLNPEMDQLLAEHGYSLLLTVERNGTRQSLLYDVGFTPHTALHTSTSWESRSTTSARSCFRTATPIIAADWRA